MKQLAILVLFAALPAAAQWRHFGDAEVRPTGWFGAGVTAPINPVASRLNTGWNLAGGVGVDYRYIGLNVDAMYNDFGITRRALFQEGARRGSQKYWAVTVDPVFHVNPRGPIDFYLTGGAGVYGQYTQLRAAVTEGGPFGARYDLISSYQIVKPGVNLGAGFSFHLGRRPRDPKLFLESRYHYMFLRDSGVSIVPVTLGVRF